MGTTLSYLYVLKAIFNYKTVRKYVSDIVKIKAISSPSLNGPLL